VVAADERGSSLAEEQVGGRANAGFDVKYGVTPGLTLDLTYNTDFSQVEVDQERVNLTRFPLFFPEQRDALGKLQPVVVGRSRRPSTRVG
jgi:hypothetical protein